MFKDFDKVFVGFDDQFNRIAKMHDDLTKNIPNYPPYNIRKTGDNTYVIEMAVAGFAKQDIELELAEGKLIVRGNVASDEANPADFLWKGIANRAFTRTFALDDQIEVQNAEYLNGMLQVFLERIIPEHKKPKKIEVKEKASKKTSKELLTEDPQDRDL
jgi:molecular chaperone IbpA